MIIKYKTSGQDRSFTKHGLKCIRYNSYECISLIIHFMNHAFLFIYKFIFFWWGGIYPNHGKVKYKHFKDMG